MNEKERLVYNLIQQNPYMSQQEMAEILGMSRPALANTISALIRKGEILGRAYILPEKKYVVAIGGANVDRKFHIEAATQLATSNPASMTENVGGVARNIAENLGRLGNQVKLLTLIGEDHDGQLIERVSQDYIQFDLVQKQVGVNTGSYTAILDKAGELVIALANMDIYKKLTPENIHKSEATLNKASCILVDLNCSKEVVEYIQQFARQRHIPLAIIPVSSPKMAHMPTELDGVHYFVCNRDEAEAYLQMQLKTMAHYEQAVQTLLAKKAKYVVLTLGAQGILVGSAAGIQHYEAVRVKDVIDVTGAGDAFVSALLHGVLHGETFEEAVHYGLVNAAKTLESAQTVRTDLTNENLKQWRNS